MRHSLRRRLNRTFIGLSLGPLLLVGIILTWLAYVVERQQTQIQQSLIAQRVTQEVRALMNEMEGELRLIAQFGLTELPLEQQQIVLLNLLLYHDHFEELILLNNVGDEQIRLARLTLVPPEQLRNHAAADQFRLPLTTGQIYYSPVIFVPTTREPLMTISIPIISPRDGQVQAVLMAQARLKQAWDVITQIPLRSGESVYIIDSVTRVVAHRNPSVVLRGAQYQIPASNRIVSGLDATYVILATERLQLGEQTLSVVAERAVWSALALPLITGSLTAGLVFLTLIIAVILGMRAVAHIIKPIQDLAQTAHTIRAGDYSQRVVVIQDDEVGELAAAFNDMTEQLRHTLAGRQQKIAELEQMGTALQSSEIRYRTIFENAQEGIYRTSAEGHFALVNPALVNMLGYASATELMALDITHDLYLTPSDRQSILERLAQEGRITNVETEWKRKDGTPITVSLSTHILYDSQQQIIGYEGLVFDMSQRRAMEQEREALIAELEAKNAELERFTYTVSHDLKSPLITIRGYLGYLEKGVKTGNLDRFQADMSRIVEATNKMQRLLAELLELSRIGRKMNPPETTTFHDIVQEALTVVEGQLINRGVQVVIAQDLPLVRGDRARLVEMVQNLLDNAAKYMGEQTNPQIDIGQSVKEGKTILFVRDNGCGIAPQYHEKIFGLFDKLDPQSEGTGVGLALVKRIVEIHGGRIWVESTGLSYGSTFFFTLPLAE